MSVIVIGLPCGLIFSPFFLMWYLLLIRFILHTDMNVCQTIILINYIFNKKEKLLYNPMREFHIICDEYCEVHLSMNSAMKSIS